MELIIYGILLIILGAFVASFGRAFFRGAPYAPTDIRAVETMVELAHIQPHERSMDIGSGDGRLIIALAKAGAKEAHGIEINRYLVFWSNMKIKNLGLEKIAHTYKKSLWKTNYGNYNVITLFGIPYIMKELEKKLLKELRPGSRVLSNKFHFPNWKPVTSKNSVHLYIKS